MMDAKAAGKRVANITDVDVTDATPAAMGASINNRSCQGLQDMGSCPAARKVKRQEGLDRRADGRQRLRRRAGRWPCPLSRRTWTPAARC